MGNLKLELVKYLKAVAGKLPKVYAAGEAMYQAGGIVHQKKWGTTRFTVPDPGTKKKWNVDFDFYWDNLTVNPDCDCDDPRDTCPHMVAAILYALTTPAALAALEKEFEEEGGEDEEEEEEVALPPAGRRTARAVKLFTFIGRKPLEGWSEKANDYLEFDLRNFSWYMITNNLLPADLKTANRKTGQKVLIREGENHAFEMDVTLGQESDTVFLLITAENAIFLSSRRRQTRKMQLPHGFLTAFEGAAWLELLHRKTLNYFKDLVNYDKEKEAVLSQYGLTLADPEAQEFVFDFRFGYLQVVKKPADILPLDQGQVLHKVASNLHLPTAGPGRVQSSLADTSPAAKPYEIAFLFNGAVQAHCQFLFEPFMLTEGAGKLEVKKVGFKDRLNFHLLASLPETILGQLENVTEAALLQKVSGSSYSYYNTLQNLSEENIHRLRHHFYQWLRQNWEFLRTYPFLYQQLPGTKFTNKTILPVTLAAEPLALQFEVQKDSRFVGLYAKALLPDGRTLSLKDCVVLGGLLVSHANTLYLPGSQKDLDVLKVFQQGGLKIHLSQMEGFLEQLVTPFARQHSLRLPEELVHGRIEEEAPGCSVYLSELETQFLLIRPVFKYGGLELDYGPGETSLVAEGKKFWTVKRNRGVEDAFMSWLREQHPAFSRQFSQPYVYLRFKDALEGRWFLEFFQRLSEKNIPVYGLNKLKQFRYNPHPPQFDMEAGSGVDWFDLKINISFGDQHVSLKELKKALAARQPYVLLGDGSIGMLPEEWLAKYGLLLSYAQENKEAGKEGTLRLSKLHFTLLEHLPLVNEAVRKELEEKKAKLREVEQIKESRIPKMKNVTLRPYQKAGFQWMQVLHQLGWGGCLADDMGLGKTLQVLTFLAALKKDHPQSTHLIVCPTSLLFNWEAEITKYAPGLSYHFYYGAGRDFSEAHYNEYDLVLTSYGTLRNDIEHLMTFRFHYIILDESQAIKNPAALTTKATWLLQARNRLVLSGTPLQNNTGDLYAQFNFLNPGMLGSYEQFKTQFGNPIDRGGDKIASAQLRHLIYPFLLRRTKEQVAADLPAKTETVLYMEMDKEQAKIYNAFKEHYRNTLLGRIEKEGLARSTIYILEGLTKLRQICNSPALLNEEEQYPNRSIKLDELQRELVENLGAHKVLVFSQFTGMLQLVREKLDREGILYEYLDGSTPAQKRKEAVKKFQKNEEVKVFLVSLKAGGVGLNLTAADYVYLVDPWWNPAVEQQAIDRTHRIGQTKKVFAYKMICRNTVEEKILELQGRKKAIASELISEETGFVKKLTKEDVEWLFT